MMRRRSLLAIGTAVVGVAAVAITLALLWPRAAGARTDLQIEATGLHGFHRQMTMRCGPVGGTVPDPADACRQLAAYSERWFHAPVLCVTTGVPGADETGPSYSVTVRGRYEGRSVSYFIFGGMCGNDQAFAGWWMRILQLPLP